MVLDEKSLDTLRRLAGNARQHAAFFHWHERSEAGKRMVELDIVNELIRAMHAANVRDFRDPRPATSQWPDCWVSNQYGCDVPTEVTELVDVEALPAGPARPWTSADICSRIQERIAHKSLRSENPAAVAHSLLVLHTDEPYLEPENVASAIATSGCQFTSTTIARAFLIFSPRIGGYHYLEIPLTPPA